MPVSAALAESNRTQTERLRQLLDRLGAATMARRLPNGWTITGILGHVAFWDRQRLGILRRWAAGDWCTGAYHGDTFNEASQALLELIPPEAMKAAVLRAAEEVDAFLLELPDELIAQALARPDAPNLDRGGHRAYHLDQIDRLLGGAHSS